MVSVLVLIFDTWTWVKTRCIHQVYYKFFSNTHPYLPRTDPSISDLPCLDPQSECSDYIPREKFTTIYTKSSKERTGTHKHHRNTQTHTNTRTLSLPHTHTHTHTHIHTHTNTLTQKICVYTSVLVWCNSRLSISLLKRSLMKTQFKHLPSVTVKMCRVCLSMSFCLSLSLSLPLFLSPLPLSLSLREKRRCVFVCVRISVRARMWVYLSLAVRGCDRGINIGCGYVRARAHAHTHTHTHTHTLHRSMIPRISTEFRAEMLHPCLSLSLSLTRSRGLSLSVSQTEMHTYTHTFSICVCTQYLYPLLQYVREDIIHLRLFLSISLSLSRSCVPLCLSNTNTDIHTHTYFLDLCVYEVSIYQSVYLYIYMAFTDLLSIYLQAQMNECVFFGIRNVTHTWRFTLQGSNKH
jgi:hypothetical protein